MSKYGSICEICNAYSHKGEFGYLNIIKSQQSSFEIEYEGRHYFCHEHKAALLDHPEDEYWERFQILRQEFLDCNEYFLNDSEESFVGEVKSPFA